MTKTLSVKPKDWGLSDFNINYGKTTTLSFFLILLLQHQITAEKFEVKKVKLIIKSKKLKMKKLVFGFVVTIMFALSGNAQTNAVGEILNYSKVCPKIVITGKLHKQNPKKDGTECLCAACFGLCDVDFVVTFEKQSNLTIGSYDLMFHVVEDIKHAEDVMYIDEDLISSYNNQKIVIKKGEYKYVKERKEIDVNGKKQISYGYSTLKIDVL